MSEINHFARAADALDAAVFSGDSLLDANNRESFRRLLDRWKRKLEDWQSIADELEANDAAEDHNE